MTSRKNMKLSDRLKIAAVAATAAFTATTNLLMISPPQDCRSRGDCGVAISSINMKPFDRLKIAAVAATAAKQNTPRCWTESAASRLPQSRRLRQQMWDSLILTKSTASRLPQSRRLRPEDEMERAGNPGPPQDCRSRGDCGNPSWTYLCLCCRRLKIAAVAATAALNCSMNCSSLLAASRLPQSRRLRQKVPLIFQSRPYRLKIAAVAATAARKTNNKKGRVIPPQDCRSRGDCGKGLGDIVARKIAASRLPQSRRLRLAP